MPETIGQQLKQARLARNLTIKKVTQVTRIQSRWIEAMEVDDFDSLPSQVQARAFLRIYAEFLELSLDGLIANQRTMASESPSASHDLEALSGQNQEPLEATTAENTTLPNNRVLQKEKLPTPRKKVAGSVDRRQRILRQLKTTTETVEALEQNQTSKSKQVDHLPAGSLDAESEEQPKKETEGSFEPDKISLEKRESQIIFSDIGKALQQRRETLSLALEEIENHIHVRKHYLQALEAGEFSQLPSSVQTRGMLNNYAHFLDMDVDEVLLQYAEGLQIQRIERQPTPSNNKQVVNEKSPSQPNFSTGLRRYFSMDVFVGIGLILILLFFVIWGTSRVFGNHSTSTPQPVAQSISDILAESTLVGTDIPIAASEEAGAEVIIPTATATAVGTILSSGEGQVQLVIVALDQAFVRVTVDGKIELQGRITAGKAYPFDGNTQIEVLTGNGAAVSILYNQSDLGTMGTLGEVVNRIYTATTILNPTVTFTPTPTITPVPSITPRPSPTPRPSSTPQRTAATQL